MRKIPFAGIELTSQRVRRLRVTSELQGRPAISLDCIIIKVDGVEGTTYNHGRPEGISEAQHPTNLFLEPVSRNALGTSARKDTDSRDHPPRQLLAYIPRPSSVASSVVGTYTA